MLMSVVFPVTSLLSLPLNALALQPRTAPLPVYHTPVLPRPVDDPAWHTLDYHAQEKAAPAAAGPNRAQASVPSSARAPRLTLLDEVGRLASPVDADKAAAWKHALHQPEQLPASEAARLHVLVGEVTLAQDENPEQALWHFAQARSLSHPKEAVYGLASYDSAVALYYEGAYAAAKDAFKRVLTVKPGLSGFDRATCALFLRHAGACAGYHDERAKLGIPEPPKLDPLCGASALAQALKTYGKPYDKKHVLANIRVTGRGSNMQDVVNGAQKLGLSAHVVHVRDAGLIALPKPLVAYVEHDHFVSVTNADKQGVTYLCADCGPWPGGRVSLTWQQWHRMEATQYAVLTKPGSDIDGALTAMLAPNNGQAQGVQTASTGGKLASGVTGRIKWMRLFKQTGITQPDGGTTVTCGYTPVSQHCAGCQSDCPTDGGNGGSGTGSGNPGDGGGKVGNPSGPVGGGGGGESGGGSISVGNGIGPMLGDPVNLATGEEEYQPGPDLTVYNPVGPSVTWSRMYNSLRGYDMTNGYQCSDFGAGWTHNYNIGVVTGTKTLTADLSGPSGQAEAGRRSHLADCQRIRPYVTQSMSGYLLEPNGARFTFHLASMPSANTPKVSCTLTAGAPMLMECDYNSATGGNYFVITMSDRTRLITQGSYGNTPCNQLWYPLGQMVDNNGNAITFNYTTPPAGSYPLLTNIVDKNGAALLTFNRAANSTGNLTSVQDRYNRSVYYNVGAYATTNVHVGFPQSMQQLDHVSQVVVTGAAGPPDRYVYGYQNIPNGEGSEAIPMLHTITVPSPTGSGTATATINYLPNYCTVSSLVDANGNSRNYSQPDASHTQVTVKDPRGNIVYRYTAGYDMNMSVTTVTNGVTDANGHNTQIIASNTYADPNNPYRASEGQTGNGYATNGANGQGTTNKTWDKYGNCTSMTTARGTTTGYNISYSNFALGELMGVQEGAKTPTTFTYYEPSGLIQTIKRATPGTSGQANQTVTYSYTYDALGNTLTASEPGNNAVATRTTTYNYTQDGQYTQTEALHQPLTSTDNLGHITHLRFDARGNMTAILDALGNETDFGYNTANQQTGLTFAATGETGTGRAQLINTFLYLGGPKTSTSQYNEAGNLAYQEVLTYGPEGESLTRTGSTQPVAQTYDALYRVKTLADGNNHATTYSYNQNGYLSLIQYPNGDTMQLPSYDSNGNPLQRIDGRGIVTNFTYNDPESKLTDVQYPATPAINVHVTYDGYGRKSSITDSSGNQTATFDDWNKVTCVTTSYTDVAAQTLNYGYNPDGSRSSLTAPYGGYSYTYDAAGRQTGLSNPGGHSWNWMYANNNWMTGQMADNTIVTTPSRDARGFILDWNNKRTDMAHTLLSDYAITYSPNLTLGSIASTVPAASAFSGTTSYQHDNKIQITSEQSSRGGSYNNAWGYDGAGNPTTFKSASQTFNAANQNTAYGYDGNGNPTSYKGNTLAFDAENRLTSYGNVLSAGYRADGQRAWKQTANGKIFYIYDGDKLLYETNAAGAVTAQNTWGKYGLVARTSGGRTLLYTWDAQGNVSQQIDASTGSIVASYMFDAFGIRGVNTADATAASDPYSGFGGSQGYYSDPETGLHLLGHRYYDPQTGRFLTRDPISYTGGVNLYECVSNSPFSGHDEQGLSEGGLPPIVDCLADFLKFLGQMDSGMCNNNIVCQLGGNCALGMATSLIIEGVCTATGPWAPLCGCLIGMAMGLLHTLMDYLCDKYSPCAKHDPPDMCNLLSNLASGCAQGSLAWIPILGPSVGGVMDGLLEKLCASMREE